MESVTMEFSVFIRAGFLGEERLLHRWQVRAFVPTPARPLLSRLVDIVYEQLSWRWVLCWFVCRSGKGESEGTLFKG